MMTITLYEGCRLSNKYDEVYNNRTDLESYLGTLTHKVVYTGEDIYFTNNGSISIDNEVSNVLGLVTHGDRYNYMKINVTTEGSRYAFIDSITLVDEICVINYTEDVWTNYALMSGYFSFEMKNSLIAQAKGLIQSSEYTTSDINNFPKKLPIAYEGHNAPSFDISGTNPLENKCYVCVTASMYKLSSAEQVNQRYISNYLLRYAPKVTGGFTPVIDGSYLWDINNQTISDIAMLISNSSDTKVRNKIVDDPDWYYEIIEVKLIPYTMGYAFFNSYLSAGQDSDAGLFTDFSVEIKKVFIGTDSIYHDFDTDIEFKQLMMTDHTLYKSGGEDRHTYNGIRPSDLVSYTKTINNDYKIIALGNMSRSIPFTPNGQSQTLKYYFNADVSNCTIELFYDNTFYDITSDFTINIPIDAQSAAITQQQKIAFKTANIVQMIGLVNSTIQLGGQIGQGIGSAMFGYPEAKGQYGIGQEATGTMMNVAGSASRIGQSAVQLDAQTAHQYVKNKAVNVDEVTLYNTLLGGLRILLCNPVNEQIVNKMVAKYGYLYSILINDKAIFNTSTNDYIRFDVANVYGNFSQSIARQIEAILENGVIMLHT